MRRRRLLIGIPLLLLVGLAAVVGVFLLRGGNEPPPPALSAAPATAATPAEPEDGASDLRVAGDSFVGYRVRETFASVGVVDAVGRTRRVTGTARRSGDAITEAAFTADLTALRSDESRRDAALETRGIETARFPEARFTLTEPVRAVPAAGGRTRTTARGELTLHGVTRPVRVTVQGQRTPDGVELVGDTRIRFADFAIEPPSVAGFVTVRDEGRLEFRLLLAG
jgi:polyisoprenoid-binding protein YceI